MKFKKIYLFILLIVAAYILFSRLSRHSVVGRKNYYGSGSHSGAETAATLFTVIESCKKNDIDPRTFLLMSLQKVARGEELETPLAFARRTRSGQTAK